MNEVIKEKWCAALRSGKYKQGYTALKDIYGRYCCLGVLQDIYERERVGDGPVTLCGGFLSHECRIWAEIDSGDGRYDVFGSLVRDNDGYRKTFEEIADIIEKNF